MSDSDVEVVRTALERLRFYDPTTGSATSHTAQRGKEALDRIISQRDEARQGRDQLRGASWTMVKIIDLKWKQDSNVYLDAVFGLRAALESGEEV